MITSAKVTHDWRVEMGEVRVKLALSNFNDEENVRLGFLKPGQVRRAEVDALVDTGATRLVLPKKVAEKLGLRQIARIPVKHADERHPMRPVVGGVLVSLMKRTMLMDAVVEPKKTYALLGQVPLELLDLWIDPISRRLVPNPESPNAPLSEME